jgi:hypothetical protein
MHKVPTFYTIVDKFIFLNVNTKLFKSNLTFCVVCVFNLQAEKSVFLRRLVPFTIDSSTPTSTPNLKKNTCTQNQRVFLRSGNRRSIIYVDILEFAFGHCTRQCNVCVWDLSIITNNL